MRVVDRMCLKKLDFSQNFLKDIKHCAINHSITSLTSLNLSHNLLTAVPSLIECLDLERLNLSHNKITDVTDIHKKVGSITKLCLQGNKIVSTAGIQYLMGLKYLDLRDNSITDWEGLFLSSLSFSCRCFCVTKTLHRCTDSAEIAFFE